MIANGRVEFAMEVLATRLGFRLQDDRSIRLFGGERRSLNLDLLDHLHVRCYGRGSGGVDVGDWNAVADDLREVEAVAIDAVGAGIGSEARNLATVGVGIEVAGVSCARDKAEQLGRAASHNVEVLHLLRGQGVGEFAGIVGRRIHRFPAVTVIDWLAADTANLNIRNLK